MNFLENPKIIYNNVMRILYFYIIYICICTLICIFLIITLMSFEPVFDHAFPVKYFGCNVFWKYTSMACFEVKNEKNFPDI